MKSQTNTVVEPPSSVSQENTDLIPITRYVRFTLNKTSPTSTIRALNQYSSLPNDTSGYKIPVKRTFKGYGENIRKEYVLFFFENTVSIYDWDGNRTMRVLFTVLRGK